MSRKRASGPIQPPDPQKAYRTGVGVVLALPIVLGVALSVLSPSHFRPLLASSLGLALLALGAAPPRRACGPSTRTACAWPSRLSRGGSSSTSPPPRRSCAAPG